MLGSFRPDLVVYPFKIIDRDSEELEGADTTITINCLEFAETNCRILWTSGGPLFARRHSRLIALYAPFPALVWPPTCYCPVNIDLPPPSTLIIPRILTND